MKPKITETLVTVNYADGKRDQYRLTHDPEGWWIMHIEVVFEQEEFPLEDRTRADFEPKVLDLMRDILQHMEDPADRPTLL